MIYLITYLISTFNNISNIISNNKHDIDNILLKEE